MNSKQQQLFQTDPAPWELDELDERIVATVVFSKAPYGPYDYSVPDELRSDVEPGRRLRVPLGKTNRTMIGYCTQVEDQSGHPRQLKPIKSVMDDQQLLSPAMMRLTKWMADYYLCHWGQAIEAVVPAGVRGRAGTREIQLLSVPTHVAARLTQLQLPPKQATAIRLLARSGQPMTSARLAEAAGCTIGPVNQLRKKGLVAVETRRVYNAEHDLPPETDEHPPNLNERQQSALGVILESLESNRHQTVLIHGVTGSGKTEVYIRAIERVISYGRQAIVMVPEISLTPQTRQRFRSRFQHVAVLHSHLTDSERHWHWQRIADGQIQVVVGARSAVFAPTPQLGLIVMDEEHDTSFKQDSLPRYHAREVAVYRASSAGVPLVLGTATPSLESWREAAAGNCQLIEMPNRVLGRPLPIVTTVDLRVPSHSRLSSGAISRPLHAAINDALRDGGQVILLLNRRGYSTIIQCPACGHVVRCPDCDVALTHHRKVEKACCHYCDYSITAPSSCPQCEFMGIRYSGLGTQRLEAEMAKRFPDVPCLRMDSDSMRKPGSHERALARFRSGEIKILIGTQMIAKGLDFPNVTLVGVVNADTALHFPDFRAAERTFQLVTQVAGRSGRGEKGGRVIVQTCSPEHPAIQAACHQSFELFARHELEARRRYGYPPFGHMIRFVFRGTSESATRQFAESACQRLRAALDRDDDAGRLLGPAAAPIAKLRGYQRFHALVVGPDREVLREIAKQVLHDLKPPDQVQWIVDVDPVDML